MYLPAEPCNLRAYLAQHQHEPVGTDMRLGKRYHMRIYAEINHVAQDGLRKNIAAAGIELAVTECTGPAFAEQHVGMLVEFSFGEEPADVAEALLYGFALLVQVYGKSATQQVEGCPQPCGARPDYVHVTCHRYTASKRVAFEGFAFPRSFD